MDQIKYVYMTKPLNKVTKDTASHTFVLFHMCSYVKFYLIRKTQLVAGGNIKKALDMVKTKMSPTISFSGLYRK